jgi:hypothetical protein
MTTDSKMTGSRYSAAFNDSNQEIAHLEHGMRKSAKFSGVISLAR